MIKPIYLDYNATTPHDPEVIKAMRLFLETEFGNPSSSHWYGIKPKQAVETARRQVAGILNCRPTEVHCTTKYSNKSFRSNFTQKPHHFLFPDITKTQKELEPQNYISTH